MCAMAAPYVGLCDRWLVVGTKFGVSPNPEEQYISSVSIVIIGVLGDGH